MTPRIAVRRVERSRLADVDFDALGFGDVFCDHMFRQVFTHGAWTAPQIVPYGPISIEPGTASLHYGQTVFEGLKAFRGEDGVFRIFRPDMNARRLRASCERLCIPPIDDAVFMEALRELVRIDHAWIPRKRGHAFYIRPLIFGTESHLDVRPSKELTFLIMTSPVRQYFDPHAPAVFLKVEEHYTRSAPGGTGFAKTAGNYAASLLPGEQSRREGYDQVLWLDGREHRYVEEVGQMNIFFKIAGRVVTPPLLGTILPGVTRDSVIALLRDKGIECEERRIAIDEVVAAIRSGDMEEIFGAGTAAVISPVGRIAFRGEVFEVNDRQPGPLSRELYDQILAIQHGEIADPHGWNMTVSV